VFAHQPDEAGVAVVLDVLDLHQVRPFDVHVGSSLMGQLAAVPVAHHPPELD